MMNEDIIREINELVKLWDNTPEHDNQFCMDYKDSAYNLFKKILEEK